VNSIRKTLTGVALVGSTLVGGALGASLVGGGASAQTSTTAPAADNAPAQRDPSQGGHVGTNGTKEELLTGDTAEKVKAAALAAVPGGTVQRVETDAEGSPYEAHMTKADGTHVTVKVDSAFKVTATEAGGPGGHR
jgi:hypothetical protein